jgi:Acetyltransferase (GNAT) domain
VAVLEIWNARDDAERARWSRLHASWPGREVFAHPDYLSLLAGDDEQPLAAFTETPAGWILYPFVLRPVATPDAAGIGSNLVDITTPYGYGGAFFSGDAQENAQAFWSAFDAWARDVGVVSEFVRFSLFDEALLRYPGERVDVQENVVRTLEPTPEELWRDFEHKVRKNVKRARANGVEIEVDERGERLDDFLRVYSATMDRRGAGSTYYFPRRFFEGIGRRLEGQFAYLHALHEGRVVSTELALVSADTVYSFLGGTEAAAFPLRPNDLLKHELILWARRSGKRRVVLGGGYAPDDGIFRYKRAFAPQGVVPFRVGRRVLDEQAYAGLVEAHRAEGRRRDQAWEPSTRFFPAYRDELPPGPA